MKNNIFRFIVLSLFVFSPGNILSQSDQYRINGEFIPGGGCSFDSNYQLKGQFYYLNNEIAVDELHILSSNKSLDNQFNITLQAAADTISINSGKINIPIKGGAKSLSGNMFYRFGGDNQYNVTEGRLNDSIFQFFLPQEMITVKGLEYCIEIFSSDTKRKLGTTSNPLQLITKFSNEYGLIDREIRTNKYNLIGFPVTNDTNNCQSVLTDDLGDYDKSIWRLGRYNTQTNRIDEYPHLPDIKPGIGYWYISAESLKFGMPGYSVLPNRVIDSEKYYEINVDSGWNQAANPYAFNIDWTEVLIEADSISNDISQYIEPYAYLYNGNNFFNASIILPWHGFFIFARQNNLKLLIPYENATPKTQKNILTEEINENDWLLTLTLATSDYSDKIELVCNNESSNKNAFTNLHKPPLPENKPFIALIKDSEYFFKEFQTIRDSNKFEFIIVCQSQAKLNITWNDNFIFENSFTYLRYDNRIIRIIKDTSIILNNSIQGEIYISSKEFINRENDIIPAHYSLNQNFPNPFNSLTTITFSLPKKNNTNIEIINLLGQQVKTVLNKDMDAGNYSFEWDGTDNNRNQVATGIYFTKLITPDYRKTIKMLLIK